MITQLDNDFSQLNRFLEELKPTQIIILTDENTHEFCLPTLLGNMETEIPFEIIEIDPGEEMKTLETAAQLWDILIEFGTDRGALFINLGGGVITDLGGFVASTYKRGISFINIPTTLLGMCDASIGGKTGIDHQFLKNVIGTFARPEKIFLYPPFLTTLPQEQLRSGFAEMLKHGLIADAQHWAALTSISALTPEALYPLLQTSMMIKQEVVQQDFKEINIRKTLNFGHTIGHAVESLFLQKNEPILHGDAVALGMICETVLSVSAGRLNENDAENIIGNLVRYFGVLSLSLMTDDEILGMMKNDKKNTEGTIKFILLDHLGQASFDHIVSQEKIRYALHYYRELAV